MNQPPPPPGHQPQVAQPALTTQDLANVMQTMAQAVTITQQQMALQTQPTGGSGGRYNVRMPSFNASQPDEYTRFERATRIALKANDLHWPKAAFAILAAFEGVALDIASTIKPESYDDTEGFLTALRELFTSPAGKNQARAEFATRIQRPGEDIMVFHGLLRDLFERAYEPQERVESHLVDCFIAGITHREAHKQLHMDRNSGHLPADYQGILVRAKGIIAQCKVIEQEVRRQMAGGQVGMDHYQQPTSWAQAAPLPNRSAPEPMEIGAVGAVSGPAKWCEVHRTNTHYTRDCRARKAQMGHDAPVQNWPNHGAARQTGHSEGPRNPGYGNQKPTAWKPNRNRGQNTTNSRCNNCGGAGHWRAQCPSPKATQGGQDHRTNAVEEARPSEANPAAHAAEQQWGN